MVLCAVACVGQDLRAQFHLVGAPEIVSFSKSDYKGGTQNWSAVQSGEGLLFFGNNKGVLEFDGTAWRGHPLPNLTIAKALATAADSSGILYVGGQDELGYLRPTPYGPAAYVSLTKAIPAAHRSFADVWKVFDIPGAGVFFCAQGAMFIWADERFEVVLPKQRFENFFEANGDIYAQDTGAGLLRWDGQAFLPVPGGARFAASRIAAVLPHPRGMLIFSDFGGLFLLNEGGIRPWETPASAFLRESHTYSAIALRDGRYAVGTVENGLLVMSQEGLPLLHLNKQSGLQNNTVLMLFQDREQNLWLGLDNGIDYVKINAPFTLIGSASGIEGTGYSAILYEGKLYMGTNQGLFFLNWADAFDPFKPLRFQRVSNLKGQVWSLQDIGGELIAGMHEGAFRIRGGQAYPLSPRKGAWLFLPLRDSTNYAIEGTYTGLSLYKKQAQANGTYQWTFVRDLKGFEESARIMAQDKQGYLWISHAYKGLYRLRLDPQTLDIADIKFYNTQNGLPTNISINVAKIKGEVVFTTPQGVYQYDAENDRFLPDSDFNDVFGAKPNMHRLMEDSSGNIWFSVGKEFGVMNVQKAGLLGGAQIDRLFFNHIPNQLVDGFEHVRAIDPHNVFIATENGFIHYNPTAKVGTEHGFHALIRLVTATASADSALQTSDYHDGSPDAEAEFPSEVKSLRFAFSAPFFEHLGKVQYRYRLAGFEEEWSDWSTHTEKEFINLPHGRYTFSIQARNAYGQMSEAASYTFCIQPPWYATLWAKGCYALLLGLLFLLLARYHARRLAQQKNTLHLEQVQQLAHKEQQLQDTQAQSEAEIVRLRNENLHKDIAHKNAELASATMHLAQKGEILLKLKKDLGKLIGDIAPDNRRRVQQLINTIEENIRLDNDWEQFEQHFDQVHENFLKNLRDTYPALTPKDLKLCAYLRMNLTTKEIAPLMNISVRGIEVSRYRLRKKLDLETDTNLVDFIMKL